MARPKIKRDCKLKCEPVSNKGATMLAYMRGEKELDIKKKIVPRNNTYLYPSNLEFIDQQLEAERKAKEKKQRYSNINGGFNEKV